MFATPPTQTPARFKALRFSFGIATSPTTQARARKLAPTVKALKPGVYFVGSCICDLWRMSCTCKTARQRKARGVPQVDSPCPHFVALYLASEWTPVDPDPVAYLKHAGIEEPEILATYCRAKLPAHYPPAPLGFRIVDAWTDYEGKDEIGLLNLHTQSHAWVKPEAVTHVHPFYK